MSQTAFSTCLQTSLHYLHTILSGRIKLHFKKENSFEVQGPAYYEDESPFAQFLEKHHPTFEEYIILLLALVPHIRPDFFSEIIAEHFPDGGDLPEFGGVRGTNHRGLLPTGETAQFVLAGNDMEKRIEIQNLLSTEHWFVQKHILWLEPVREGEPVMSGRLILDPEVVELLTSGIISRPKFSIDFPAEYIETEMEWHDLVLHQNTLRQIREIEHWIMFNEKLMKEYGMKKKIKPGYRALFYGPPGTGKTLTATLLGKYTGRDVFRIDLSRVVSKYIGETAKNLARLFDKAENKNWILFFDEADSIFGKRTDIRDAHDKYANQEVAYLLQRVEGYNGLVILASNQRANIDEAFTRRFQAIIHFPIPRAEERLELWRKAFPDQIELDADIDWQQVSSRYELTGSNIINIAHYSSIAAMADNSHKVNLKQIEKAIHREYVKDGKVV